MHFKMSFIFVVAIINLHFLSSPHFSRNIKTCSFVLNIFHRKIIINMIITQINLKLNYFEGKYLDFMRNILYNE